jgi:hypothetical protein
MAEIVLFNHIPKTAGSTMRRILFRAVGGTRIAYATTLGRHPDDTAAIVRRLEALDEGPLVVLAHTGCGIERLLPQRHEYRSFTMLREPIDRTISIYYYSLKSHGMSLREFLETHPEHAYNHQTAFLGGLTARHHLEGEPIEPARFDRELVERAKRNLERHRAIGLTERFDESLAVLREAYGWPMPKTFYLRTNVGEDRRDSTRPRLTEEDLAAVRAFNELDLEIYDHACDLFATRLEERVPDHDAALRRFRRLNAAYGKVYPVAYPPASAVARGVRRWRPRQPA